LALFAEVPNLYMVFLGDGLDNPVKYQWFDQTINPKLGRLIFAQMMDRIKPKILAMLSGDHERHGVEKADLDYVEEYARTRRIPFLGQRGRLNLVLKDRVFRIGLSHRGKGQSYYNPFHGLVRLIREEFPDADAVFAGHIHQSACAFQVEQGRQRALLVIGTKKVGDRFAEAYGFSAFEEAKRLPVLKLYHTGEMELISDILLLKKIKVY
jgi:hypothetical protein